MKNPCNELNIVNSHWNNSLASLTAANAKTQVKPSKREQANAIRDCFIIHCCLLTSSEFTPIRTVLSDRITKIRMTKFKDRIIRC